MNQTRRTVIYVVVACVLAILAWKLSPPVEITPAELVAASVGTEFYPDFKDPNEPTSIRVVAFDEAKATHKTFGVAFENGKWTIPSHHHYPADAADRLAKTAASVMHIKREEIVLGGETEQAHEKLGVVDPLDEDPAKLKGRGQRITLSKGDTPLVDFIIGKQLRDRPDFHYLRKVDDNKTYVAKLKIDLSTKFSDWIETDLLKLNRDDLKEVVINNYSVDEARGVLVEGEINKLDREKTADPWKLEGLDEAKEELDVSKVNSLISTLDDLKLVGVRPKPKGFRPDLTLDRDYVKRQSDLDALVVDLQRRGYFLQMDRNKQLHLYSNEGELVAATNKGIVYTLKFGEVFAGDEAEIEIGGVKEGDDEEGKGDKKKDAAKEDEAADDAKDKKDKQDKPEVTPGKQPSRYLFVTAQFDESYLGERPTAPERPEGLPEEEESEKAPDIKPGKKKPHPLSDDAGGESKPGASGDDADEPGKNGKSGKANDECGPPTADDEPAAKNEGKSAGDAREETDKGEKKEKAKEESAGDRDAEEKDKGDTEGEKPAAEEKEKKTSPEELKKEYDASLKKYKSDLKAYEDKVEAGKKQAEELSARFGEWYYVIPAESFNKLHLKRSDLVKSKTKPAGDTSTSTKPEASDDTKTKDPFADEAKESTDKDDDAKDAAKDDEAEKDKAKKDEAKKDGVKEADSTKGAAKKPAEVKKPAEAKKSEKPRGK